MVERGALYCDLLMCLKLHGAHRPMLRGCVYIYVVICGFALFRAEALRHPLSHSMVHHMFEYTSAAQHRVDL